LESEGIKDRREEGHDGGVNGFYIGEAMERDEFGLRVGGFVMSRSHADVPQSASAGAALLSGGEMETMTERALE